MNRRTNINRFLTNATSAGCVCQIVEKINYRAMPSLPELASARTRSKLLREREDVYGVAAAGRIGLGSQVHSDGRERAATSRDGDILAAVD
jgi:hypothetical protein